MNIKRIYHTMPIKYMSFFVCMPSQYNPSFAPLPLTYRSCKPKEYWVETIPSSMLCAPTKSASRT